MRIKLRIPERLICKPILAGRKERCKTNHQVLWLGCSDHLVTATPTGFVKPTTVSENRPTRYVKMTRRLPSRPSVGYHHVKRTTAQRRNREHFDILPTYKKRKFPCSTLLKSNLKVHVAGLIPVVRGELFHMETVAAASKIQVGGRRGKKISPKLGK